MKLFQLFPTSVVREEHVLSPDQLESIFDHLLTIPTNKHDAFDGDASSSRYETENLSDINCLESISKNILPEIENIIEYYFDQYTTLTGIRPVKIDNSWFNIQNEGSVLQQHDHPHSIVSMALYINTPENSNSIVFENPNNVAAFTNEVLHFNELNWSRFTIDVKAGDLIMFPSWLRHGSYYQKNKSNNRTVISINTKYK